MYQAKVAGSSVGSSGVVRFTSPAFITHLTRRPTTAARTESPATIVAVNWRCQALKARWLWSGAGHRSRTGVVQDGPEEGELSGQIKVFFLR